jgi:putative membrane protein
VPDDAGKSGLTERQLRQSWEASEAKAGWNEPPAQEWLRVATGEEEEKGMITKRAVKRIWLCSIPALVTSVALAQAPTGGGAPQQPTMPSQSPSATAGAPGAGTGTAPAGQSFGDQAFVTKALEGGMAEVQLGQLAQEKSQSNDVKQFAQKMVSDHTQMGDKWFKPVAKELGVSEPKGPSKKDKKLIEKLQALSGPDFDTQYIQAMVKDHKQDLKEFQAESEAAQDPNLKQVAQQGTKVISQHLQMIDQIAQNHNVAVDGKEVSKK